MTEAELIFTALAELSTRQIAEKMEVTQAYISKLEAQDKISAKVLSKVMAVILNQDSL
jgi:predicted transcriptional regulator